MLHDIGDPPEVCVGDDLCLLAKRQPGGVRGHGQHAHHVQHQQQVQMQGNEICFALNVIKAFLVTSFSVHSTRLSSSLSILLFFSPIAPTVWA